MTSLNLPPLQKLRSPDGSVSESHGRLNDILRRDEYRQYVSNLRGEDLTWLVDHLDKVRHRIVLPTLHLSQRRRLSSVSILPAQLPGAGYTSSEAYVARKRFSQSRTTFHLTFFTSIPVLLPPVIVMCSRGRTMVQRFA